MTSTTTFLRNFFLKEKQSHGDIDVWLYFISHVMKFGKLLKCCSYCAVLFASSNGNIAIIGGQVSCLPERSAALR